MNRFVPLDIEGYTVATDQGRRNFSTIHPVDWEPATIPVRHRDRFGSHTVGHPEKIVVGRVIRTSSRETVTA